MTDCPFCHLDPAADLLADGPWAAFLDRFPVSPGHTLLVPRRHLVSFMDLDESERGSVIESLHGIIAQLRAEFAPDGFNVGINDGRAAGQTVMHLHVHVIPRYDGDVADPRGGVRGVIPDKTAYWGAADRGGE